MTRPVLMNGGVFLLPHGSLPPLILPPDKLPPYLPAGTAILPWPSSLHLGIQDGS